MSVIHLDALAPATAAGFRDLPPDAALAHLDALVVVDVREPEEFDGPLGHVAGARLVPLATLPEHAGSLPADAPILVVCRSGGRSARAATELVRRGLPHVYNLAGGMLAWQALGLPVARG